MAKSLLDRMADRVLIGDGCWEWTGAHLQTGYASVHVPGSGQTQSGVHRVLYELLIGPIPAGLHLHHLCQNPGCVRPAHLQPISQAEHSRHHDFLGTYAREVKPTRPACRNGHQYPAEPRIDGRGARLCKICNKERMDKCRAKHGARWNAEKREKRARSRLS